jgi:DNA-binding transcriptional regulator YdaS (Cro superfamily)
MDLASYLQREQISPPTFAAKLGVAPSTVWHWLNGTKFPGRDNLAAIRSATGGDVTPNDFLSCAAE